MDVKDVLNQIIKEDINAKELIRLINKIGNSDPVIRGAQRYLYDLNSDIISSLQKLRNLLTELSHSIDCMSNVRFGEQNDLGKELTNYAEQYKELEESYTKAYEHAERRINRQTRQELMYKPRNIHVELETELKNRMKKNHKNQEIETSQQLVNDLRELSRTLQNQTNLSKLTANTLNEDADTIQRTRDLNQTIDTNSKSSDRLVGKYGRRELWDRALIAVAFIFFICICLYIVFKRLGKRM